MKAKGENRLGRIYWGQTCHKTGESAVATGAEGAEGVCVLMIYCSGAAYLRKHRKLNPQRRTYMELDTMF